MIEEPEIKLRFALLIGLQTVDLMTPMASTLSQKKKKKSKAFPENIVKFNGN